MDEIRVERVLRVVESLPTRQVATYGDIGAVVGESPRWVGRVLKLYGSNVEWWRVVNAKGEIPGCSRRVQEYWQVSCIELKGERVDLKKARIAVDALRKLSSEKIKDLSD